MIPTGALRGVVDALCPTREVERRHSQVAAGRMHVHKEEVGGGRGEGNELVGYCG